jgi:hypothetical protein
MRKRTQILFSALIGGASLAAAIPAQAQSYRGSYDQRYDDRDGNRYDDRYDHRYDRNDHYRGNANAIWQQIQQLQYRVERSDSRDRVSEREAAGLRRAVWDLRQQFRDYNRNGLSHREARILQDRIDYVRDRLRYERRDRDGRRW